jgi:hypothetical protein
MLLYIFTLVAIPCLHASCPTNLSHVTSKQWHLNWCGDVFTTLFIFQWNISRKLMTQLEQQSCLKKVKYLANFICFINVNLTIFQNTNFEVYVQSTFGLTIIAKGHATGPARLPTLPWNSSCASAEASSSSLDKLSAISSSSGFLFLNPDYPVGQK